VRVESQLNSNVIKENMKGKKYRGQVVLWDENRMFGFIQTTEMLPFGGEKIFVHHLNCIDTLSLGAQCEFEIGDAYKLGRKPQAVRVTVRLNAAGLDALATGFAHPIKDAVVAPEIGGIQAGV
jgi:cold shock CspA family protein